MTDVSSLIYVGLDPDSGFPSSLVGMGSGDTITSSILPESVRNILTNVVIDPVGSEVSIGGVLDVDTTNGTIKFKDPTDGQSSVIIETTENYLSSTTNFDVSGLGTIEAGTADLNAADISNLTVESAMTAQDGVLPMLPRGYIAKTDDRFAVDGSGIGSGANNLYVTNGAGPFIYYETSTNGSVRNGANEFGLGAVPTYTVSSTPDSYLSGTIPAFYEQDTYCRTIVSSTGVYEIQSMLNLSATSEIDIIYNIKVDIANLADTVVGVAAPHFRIVKLQAVKFLTAGQEIRVSLTAGANHLIGSGSNLLIKRIG
jgi:hypothetical protein